MENISQEVWRPIDGFEDYYQVSSLGRVKSCDRLVTRNGRKVLRRGRVLKPQMNNNGYLNIYLWRNNKGVKCYIHRLVAKAFPEICGEYRNGREVDHKNAARTDNRAENLHWVTRSENNLNPITRKHMSDSKKGEKHPMWGKFGKDNSNSIPIIQYDLQGNFIAQFDGLRDAERKLGISHENICAVLKGRSKSAKGYIFEYKEQ